MATTTNYTCDKCGSVQHTKQQRELVDKVVFSKEVFDDPPPGYPFAQVDLDDAIDAIADYPNEVMG